MIEIADDLLARIPALLWDWEVERVCIIVGIVPTGHLAIVEDLWIAENKHHDPFDNFALTKPQWEGFKRKAVKMGQLVLGIGHSHPFTAIKGPSAKDIHLSGQRIANFVYHSQSSTVSWYTARGVFREEHVPMPRPLALWNKIATYIDNAEQRRAAKMLRRRP